MDSQGASPARKVALTEWNFWSAATSHGRYVEPADGAHVLFAAAVLRGLVALGDAVELANYYSLLNWFGAIQVNGPNANATAVADLFRLYGSILPAYVVPCQLDIDSLEVTCFETEDSARRWLVLENWSVDDEASVDLEAEWVPVAVDVLARLVGSGRVCRRR